MCTDYGIQYRDGHDVVFAWFLRNGYGYRRRTGFSSSCLRPPALNSWSQAQQSHLTREIQTNSS